VVALFGALHPAGIVPAAAFFGLMLIGADMTQRSAGVPANMVLVLEGVIILAIVSARMYVNNPYAQERAVRLWRRAFGAGRPSAGGPPGSGAAAGEGTP
jgi:general nucleoside transport system permease protein